MTKRILLLLLSGSIALNVWQWMQPHVVEEGFTSPKTLRSESAPMATPNTALSDYSPNHTDIAASNTSIDQLRTLLRTQQYAELTQKLNAALRAHPFQFELLMLEAELIRHTQPLNEALLYLLDLLELPLSAEQHEEIRSAYYALLTQSIEQLEDSASWDLLAQTLEPLWQRLSSDRDIILRLAGAYARQDKPELMEDVLASLMPNDPGALAIRTLLPAHEDSNVEPLDPPPIASADTSFTVLPLIERGNQFQVPFSINDSELSLLLDTGASTVAITQTVYERLRAAGDTRFLGIFTVRTAGGEVEAPMIRVRQVEIAGYRLNDVSVLVMPVDTMGNSEGLLGMNVLKQFEFRLDQNQAQLLLRPANQR